MLIDRTTTLFSLIKDHRKKVIVVLLIVLVVEFINDYIELQRPGFSFAAVGLLVTALSIFLVFRVNEAYSRWWEARTLWGGIVNASRSFTRQVTTLLHPEDASEINPAEVAHWRRELVYRQIAYINALRMSLRRENNWDSLAPFLEQAELAELKGNVNKPAQLIQTQGRRLNEARRADLLDPFRYMLIDRTLVELIDLQGGCERIKNTVFPDNVAFFTKTVAWSLACLIAISVIDASNRIDPIDMVVIPLMMLAFVLTEKLGSELKNPFEGRPQDTPMTALCRSIEIDLREQLGETDLPEPLQPVDGVLM